MRRAAAAAFQPMPLAADSQLDGPTTVVACTSASSAQAT